MLSAPLFFILFSIAFLVYSFVIPITDELAPFSLEVLEGDDSGFRALLDDNDFESGLLSNEMGLVTYTTSPNMEEIFDDPQLPSNEITHSPSTAQEYDPIFSSDDPFSSFNDNEDLVSSHDSNPPLSADLLLPPTSMIAQTTHPSSQAGLSSKNEFDDRTPDENRGMPECKFPRSPRCCPPEGFFKCRPWSFSDPLCAQSKHVYCCENVAARNDEGDYVGWEFVCEKTNGFPSWVDDMLNILSTPIYNPIEDLIEWIPPGLLGPAGDNQWGVGS
jgi:hypothetical protein